MKTTRMLLFTILIAIHSYAEERREYYNGVRALGMGGAYVCTVNDETALFLNPAALGKLRGPIFTVVDPEGDGGAGVPGILSKGGGGTTEFIDEPQALLDKLNLSPDKYFHVNGQMSPSFVVPNFGFGVLGKYQVDGEVVSETNRFNYFYRNDLALHMAFALRIWDGRIKLGIGGKAVNRAEVDTDYAATTTGLRLKDIVREGAGVGGEAGLILTAPWAWLPSIGAAWHDAGGTSYDLNDGFLYDTDNRPRSTRQVIDAGFSIQPIMGNQSRLLLTGEYRDVLTSGDETDLMKRIHAGIEFNFADTLFLRGGMHQRYWSAGMEFAMYMFQFQVASYGEEIGTSALTREDRRYVGKFSFRF